MPITYKIDVLQALKDRGYTSYRLRKEKIVGERVIQQLREQTPVSWEVLTRICDLLDCQPGDVLERAGGGQLQTDATPGPTAPEGIEPPDVIRARLTEIQGEKPTAESIVREIWETQRLVTSTLWCNVFYDSKVYKAPKDAQAVRAALVTCKEQTAALLDNLIENIDRQQGK